MTETKEDSMDYLTLTGAEQSSLPKDEQVKIAEQALTAEYERRAARLSALAALVPKGEEITVQLSIEIACEQAAVSTLKQMARMWAPYAAVKWLPPAGLQEMQIDQIEIYQAKEAVKKGEPSEPNAEPVTVAAGSHGGYL